MNKKLGNDFEQEFCDILASYGWWCHNMAQNKSGQPADVIAVANDIPVLIDCKVCTHDRFPLTRIEENQQLAMSLWADRGNYYAYFAMKLSNGNIHMVPYREMVRRLQSGERCLYYQDIILFPLIRDWMRIMGVTRQ